MAAHALSRLMIGSASFIIRSAQCMRFRACVHVCVSGHVSPIALRRRASYVESSGCFYHRYLLNYARWPSKVPSAVYKESNTHLSLGTTASGVIALASGCYFSLAYESGSAGAHVGGCSALLRVLVSRSTSFLNVSTSATLANSAS
jgi:hypothetical protein